jgi:hypothetical protein
MLVSWCAVTLVAAWMTAPASAHCDGLDGPVVKAAQAALAKGDVALVLMWVKRDDEATIRRAFERTLEMRTLGPKAAEFADHYFFETLVRVHRAGEGATYTGLKPAGTDLGAAIPAADRALESGDPARVADLVAERVRAGLLERYNEAKAARNFKPGDVEAGRAYVAKYVTFIHYVEGIYETATRAVSGHYHDPEPAAPGHAVPAAGGTQPKR